MDPVRKVITVTINGEVRQLPSVATVADLVKEMGLAGKRIALERNGDIVPRSTFAAQRAAARTKERKADQVEIWFDTFSVLPECRA